VPVVENMDVVVAGTSAIVSFIAVDRLVSYNVAAVNATGVVQTISRPDVASDSIGTTISESFDGLDPGLSYNFTVDIAVENHDREVINTATETQSTQTLGELYLK